MTDFSSRTARYSPAPTGRCLRRPLFAGILLVASILGLIPLAQAHERIGTVSHSIVTVRDNTVAYYINVPPALSAQLKLELDDSAESWRDYFAATVRITTWDALCELAKFDRITLPATANTLFDLLYRCPREVRDLAIYSVAFLDVDESHTQFARLAKPDNPAEFLREDVLTAKHQTFHVPDVRSGGSAWFDRGVAFFALGVEHLLTGYDHILFLLAVIIAMTLRETIKAVTSFTVAHSLTMALAFFGFVSLPGSVVEPLIALTIVYVAVENVFAVSIRRRWLLTFVFGLIHGLGFVGVLKEITVSRSELLLSLASFNIGIEFGQLLVVVIAVPLFHRLRSYDWGAALRRWFSLSVGGLGIVWAIQRVAFAG
jgi:hydrogenase/urease accessory protein HupE